MTDKAYIVANKEQELDVLKKFEQKNLFWDEGEKPTEWVPSETAFTTYNFNFPYVISSVDDEEIIWFMVDEITDEEIVYDGRKEEKMYKVTQEFMNELIKWRDSKDVKPEIGKPRSYVDGFEISNLPIAVRFWWQDDIDDPFENNRRLIAIIQWLNGGDVFEVEKPHKFVVRSEKSDNDGDYIYVQVKRIAATNRYYVGGATKFDTREEAQEWANSHQVVVEIDEEGNEVE